MTRRQMLVGVVEGLVVATLVLLVLRSLTLDFTRHELLRDTSALRLTAMWFVGLGAAMAVVLVLSESNPLVTGVPAVLLGIGYTALLDLPLIRTGTWIPWTVRERLLASFGPASVLLVGMLAAASAWGIWRVLRTERPGAHEARGGVPERRRWLLVGAICGAAAAVALPFVLRALTLEWRHFELSRIVARVRPVAGWFILFGVVIAAVVIVSSRASPLLAAVPAVVLALGYSASGHVRLIGPEGWLPPALRQQFAGTVGPSPYLLIGVLAAAAVLGGWTQASLDERGPKREKDRGGASTE